MGISFAIDGYFITACSAEGATKDESLAQGNLHALMRPGPRNAQGNLLALQWHLIAGYSLNFVVDLIQSLVIGLENIPKIVMSSDARKREM